MNPVPPRSMRGPTRWFGHLECHPIRVHQREYPAAFLADGGAATNDRCLVGPPAGPSAALKPPKGQMSRPTSPPRPWFCCSSLSRCGGGVDRSHLTIHFQLHPPTNAGPFRWWSKPVAGWQLNVRPGSNGTSCYCCPNPPSTKWRRGGTKRRSSSSSLLLARSSCWRLRRRPLC